MKFLIDRCAGHTIAKWLTEQGHEVVEVSKQGPDPGDRAILSQAASEKRVLITLDKDFGQFIFLEGVPHYGIIRLPDVPAKNRIQLVAAAFEVIKSHELAQLVVTIREGRIRITHSPRKKSDRKKR